MSAPQPAGERPYIVLTTSRDTNVNPATRTIQQGWQVHYQDRLTGSYGDVFVPDGTDLNAYADALIRQQLEQLHALHGVG